MYVRRELIEELEPSVVGYRSAEDMSDLAIGEFHPARAASRFEHGQPNFAGYAGLTEAIKLLESIGLNNIEKRIMNLTGQLIDGIEDMKGIWLESSTQLEHRSGIVRISSHDSEKLHQQLQERQIPTTYRFNGLRISPHFYNTCEEVETFLTTLQELVE